MLLFGISHRNSQNYFLIRNILKSRINIVCLSQNVNTPSEDEKTILTKQRLQSFRSELNSGPQLGDFIGGVVPRNTDAYSNYSGKIKRESGETGRFVHTR